MINQYQHGNISIKTKMAQALTMNKELQ
jgi:hypothetical protein